MKSFVFFMGENVSCYRGYVGGGAIGGYVGGGAIGGYVGGGAIGKHVGGGAMLLELHNVFMTCTTHVLQLPVIVLWTQLVKGRPSFGGSIS